MKLERLREGQRAWAWGCGLAIAAALSGSCSLNDVQVPAIDGPSTHALSVVVTANPDWVKADGLSTSTVVVTVRDTNGQAVTGQGLVLMIGNATGADAQVGSLSASRIVTGTDGRARVIYTAPATKDVDVHTFVFVKVRPESTDFGGQWERSVSIEVIPVDVRTFPPTGPATPHCEFITEPRHGPWYVNVPVLFQSVSYDSGGYIVSYVWDFDENTGHFEYGPEKYHTYTEEGNHIAFHSVTDNTGAIDSCNHVIEVLPAP